MNKIVSFKPFEDKIPDVLLYVMSRESGLSQYQIVEAIFIADVSHLNKYGRPVTFDNYVAMKHGPVPSFIYDLLEKDENYREHYKSSPPWSVEADQQNPRVRHYMPLREPDTDRLSASDRRMLDAAVDAARSMTFGAMRDFTHDHPAYEEARELPGNAPRMMWESLYDDKKNKGFVHELAYMSESR